MKTINTDAQNLRTMYSEKDVDRIEDEILRGGEGSDNGSGSGSGSMAGSKFCFYDCLEKTGRRYHVKDANGKFISNSKFAKSYPGDETEKEIGPYTQTDVKDENGKPVTDRFGNKLKQPNPEAHNFINNYFETKDDSWQEDKEKIRSYVIDNNGGNDGDILAILNITDEFGHPSKNSHAVIIEDYDSTKGYYCWDPSIRAYRYYSSFAFALASL